MTSSSPKAGRKPKLPITIALDCGALSDPDELSRAGVFSLVKNLVTELINIDHRNHYILYSYTRLSLFTRKKFQNRLVNRVLPRFGFKNFWLPLVLKLDQPNVFLALSQATPYTKIPVIGFVYDLAFNKYPNAYKNKQRLIKNTRQLIARSNHIITVSESSRQDLIRTYLVDSNKISVSYPGVSSKFRPDGSKYIDSYAYFLYVGALKPTKNIYRLLYVFAKFLQSTPKKYKLILVGSKKRLDPEIPQLLQKLNLISSVELKGYVSELDLPKYYRGALVFISLANFEGFGLPILEALSSGVPVIAAKNTSQPEVVGNSGILVDPTQNVEILQAMQLLLQPYNQKIYRNLALDQARKFSINKFTRQVLRIIETNLSLSDS